MKFFKARERNKGFTLVELLVAVALFAVVMLVAVGALLSLVLANRKAQALQSVMNNLNITLDDMARSIRMGSSFYCGTGVYTPPSELIAQDCSNGDTAFAFIPYGKRVTDPARVYKYDATTKSIMKSEDGGSSFVTITAGEVEIESLTFYVVGTQRGDTQQPKVVIIAKGNAGTNSSKTTTSFHIQVTAVQRLLDL